MERIGSNGVPRGSHPELAYRTLEIAFGVLFLWLGILKVVPGISPAEDLMRASLPGFLPIDLVIRVSAIWEILVGLGFLSRRLPRLTLLMTFATMAVTLSLLALAPDRIWTTFPLLLSFEGQYVIKDLVIATSAAVLATRLVGRDIALHGRLGDLARRAPGDPIENYRRWEARILGWFQPLSVSVVRVALGIVFAWLGAQNLQGEMSPAWPLVERAAPSGLGVPLIMGLGALELVAGLAIVVGRLQFVAIGVAVAVLLLTLSFFIVQPQIVFSGPLVLTLAGQHILKNLILLSAAIVVLTVRPESGHGPSRIEREPEHHAADLP